MSDAPAMGTFNLPVPGQGIPGPQATYPVQPVSPNAPGAPSRPTRFGGFMSGYQSVINAGNQEQQMKRSQQEYDEQQAKNKAFAGASALPPPGSQSQTGDGHSDFIHSLVNSPAGQAVMAGVHAIGNFISGGQQPPAAAQQGPPAPAPAAAQQAAEQQGPPAPIQSQMNGGVVHDHTLPFLETAPPGAIPHPTVLAFAGGGPIPGNGDPSMSRVDSFGVRDGSTQGIPGFEDGGAIPPAAPAQGAAPAPQPPASIAAPNGNQPAQEAYDSLVHGLFSSIQDHTLNDAGVPNKDQAVPNPAAVEKAADAPTPPPTAQPPGGTNPEDPAGARSAAQPQQAAATAQAVQSVGTNQAAQQGVPESTPDSQDKPHSISPEQWAQWDANIDKAVQAGAMAGHDPGQVRAALEANRNAWVQGHVLRNLSAANAALINNDQKGVETALKNAYYYMPDGKDMTINKGPDGKLQYQDPVNPYVNDKGQTSTQPAPGFKPNMVPVDAAHIKMVGQALLDPMNLQDTIQNIRVASAKMELERAQAQAATLTGQGNFLKGKGIDESGQAKLGRMNSENFKDYAAGRKDLQLSDYWKFKVNDIQKTQRMDPGMLKKTQDAASEYDKIALGRETVIPYTDPATGLSNPNGGKPTRDTRQVPAWLKNASPQAHAYNKGVAADIAASNPEISAPTAAYLAASMANRGGSHLEDGKRTPNVLIDKKQNTGHVWDERSGKYVNFHLTPDTASNIASGKTEVTNDDLLAASSGSSGGGNGAEASEPDASQEPDMEPQTFPES